MPHLLLLLFLLAACNNNPWGSFPDRDVFYSAISDDPRTLDPARVSDTASNLIASNLHDTPYEYHYLKRPLELVPAMATGMPQIGKRTINGQLLTSFRFSIKKGLFFQDDVCFANGRGREIKIHDIIYNILRAADPSLDPFGLPLLMGKVLGFDEFMQKLEKATPAEKIALYREGMPGVRALDDYTLELLLTQDFPQIRFFFAATMGAPVPPECLAYYDGSSPDRPTFDRHPVASGPFFLKEWKANYRIVLEKNPNYRTDDLYPEDGNAGDEEAGFLTLAGRKLPLVESFHFQIIKAGSPIWRLFEQGYLDRAGIPVEVFNQVIYDQDLAGIYKERGIRLDREVGTATYWWYYNMEDPLFKNNPELRRALSLAIDRKEMIERFHNGRGLIAHSLLPPGLEGYEEDFKNPYSEFDLARARELMALAGYKDGIDPKTNQPLKVTMTLVASAQGSSRYRFFIEQFRNAGVDLKIETLDWPTVLERKNKKTFQMIHGGWHADYPDPQNFFQLFYGPNVKSTYNENHYQSAAFDALYLKTRGMPSGKDRVALLREMKTILALDAPVILLFHPLEYGLAHTWVSPIRPHPVNTNQLKFRALDRSLRKERTRQWNSIF